MMVKPIGKLSKYIIQWSLESVLLINNVEFTRPQRNGNGNITELKN